MDDDTFILEIFTPLNVNSFLTRGLNLNPFFPLKWLYKALLCYMQSNLSSQKELLFPENGE